MARESIGAVAAERGISPHTVRYYEQAGLIPPVLRDGAGRRVFDQQSRDWLDHALCMRRLGMDIAGVRRYVAAMTDGQAPDAEVMRAHLEDLKRRRSELDHYIALIVTKIAAREAAR